MQIRIFDLPTTTRGFVSRGWVTGAVEISTAETLTAPAWWSVTIPQDAARADALTVGRMVEIDGGYYGIIENISAPKDTNGRRITVSGYDLKGLVRRRIVMPDASGYAAYNGTTETIFKALIEDNLGRFAGNLRSMHGVAVAADLARGTASDRWRGRYDPLDSVLAELCMVSGLGYTAAPDLAAGKVVFDVIAGANRSASQSDRPRIVLAASRRTLASNSYTREESDSRNLVYATLGGYVYAEDALTQSYIRAGENEPTGYDRREMAAEYGVGDVDETERYDELRRLALADLEQHKAVESFSGSAAQSSPVSYGKDYFLGDIVTVLDAELGVTADVPVTEVRRNYNASGVSTAITFGSASPSVFGRMRRQIKTGW